jgi:hypothetical protein
MSQHIQHLSDGSFENSDEGRRDCSDVWAWQVRISFTSCDVVCAVESHDLRRCRSLMSAKGLHTHVAMYNGSVLSDF